MDTIIGALVIIFGYDIWFYYSHVLLHTRYLYKYHKKHHEHIHPTATTSYYGHISEDIVSFISIMLTFLIFYPNISILSTTIGAIYTGCRGLAQHEPRFVNHPILKYLCDDHHLLHHKHFTGNYGAKWIDWLHGTTINKINIINTTFNKKNA